MSNQIARAVKWSAFGSVGRFALQLVAQVILARILGPEIYGLFGIGLLVYSFGEFFSSFGFARKLLQKQAINEEDIRFAYTWQIIMGGLATLAILICSPLIAQYLNAPNALSVIQWLSVSCLLNAANASASNLLQRDLDYKTGARIQFISYGVGYLCLGIPLALMGFGVYALVIAWLMQLLITLVATYLSRPHSLKPLFWFKDGVDSLNYGGTVFITNIVNWLLTNLDRVVIARLLNVQSVGFYTLAYNLASAPNNLMLGGLQTISLASGAKIADDTSKMAEGYQSVLAAILVLILPIFIFLAVLAPDIIAVIYGSKWLESGEILSILFLGMPVMLIWGLSTPILWNTGRRHLEFILQIPVLIAGGWMLFAFAHKGLNSVAWVVLAIYTARALVISGAAMRALHIRWLAIAPDLIRGIVISGIIYAAVKFLLIATEPWNMPGATLVISLLLASGMGLVLLFKFPLIFGVRAQNMLSKFHPAMGAN